MHHDHLSIPYVQAGRGPPVREYRVGVSVREGRVVAAEQVPPREEVLQPTLQLVAAETPCRGLACRVHWIFSWHSHSSEASW